MGKKQYPLVNHHHLLIVLSVFVLAIFITGCTGNPNANPGNAKYRTGYDSLDMTFASGSPPDTFNYDSSCDLYSPTYSGVDCQNEIPIVLQIKNTGASDAYGFLYIHGYDPNIISIAGDQAYMPMGNAFSNPVFNDNMFSFSFGNRNTYFGFMQQGTGQQSMFSATYHNQRVNYGAGAFGSNGDFYTMNVVARNPDGSRIGFSVGKNFFSSYINGGWCPNNVVCGFRSIIALAGDNEETPGGDIQVYDFPAYLFGLPESLETFNQPIMATACYTYATRTTAMMCIDPRPNSNARKVCTPASVTLSGGQGGPIAITSIEQQPSNQRTVFTIHVKLNKKGTYDQVFDWPNLAKCNPNSGAIVRATDLNVVYVDYIALSGLPGIITCAQPTNYGYRIRLDDSGNGQITCTAELGTVYAQTQGAYEAPLTIDLAYGYSKSVQKLVNIRKI